MYISKMKPSCSIVLGMCATVYARAADKLCSLSSSKSITWTIRDFAYRGVYENTTPAHQDAHGSANFTLENTALSYETECKAAGTRLPDFLYGETVYQCAVKQGEPTDRTAFTVSVSRNGADGVFALKINQTWGCGTEGAQFSGVGAADLHVKCDDKTYTNKHWAMGETYSKREVTCGTASTPVNITYLEAAA